MAMEIERKFLVDEVPAGVLVGGVHIRQGYLAVDGDVEVRVRVTNAIAELTVKAGRGRARTEVAAPLPIADGETLLQVAAVRSIDKVRSRVAILGGIAEIDVYSGTLDGLRTVEVELADDAAADRFVPPPWFGRELTGDPAWSNAALAAHGRPDR